MALTPLFPFRYVDSARLRKAPIVTSYEISMYVCIESLINILSQSVWFAFVKFLPVDENDMNNAY